MQQMTQNITGGKVDEQRDGQADYLSKENTNCLKGVLAIGILVHHLYQHTGLFRDGWSRLLGYCLQASGYLIVAIFFFLSGYGLAANYQKTPSSIYHFGKHKIAPFYVINIFLGALYCGMRLLVGEPITIGILLKTLTFGDTVIQNGWYIQVQLLYYVFFYFAFRIFNEKWQMIVMMVLNTAYVIICKYVGLSSLYYERTFIFVIGILWLKNRDVIDGWIDRKRFRWACIWCISCLLFMGTYLMSSFSFPVLFRGVSYYFLIPSVILLLKKARIENKVTRFLGNISFEIYAMQGVFILLFHSNIAFISNPYLFSFSVAISTIVSAIALHPLIRQMYRVFRSH